MKRIITVLIVLSLTLANVTVMASQNNEDGILKLLTELNIMQGDGNGNYRLDDAVSRAEFTKVAVAASSYKNTVAKGLKMSPFCDVPYTHWSAPYVKAGVSAKLVQGYLDATFRPDDTVLYEEAITILLRVLGYSDSDFGASWPYGQIGMAEDLKLLKNVNSEIGKELTRREVANLVYNALNAKMKDSPNKLISVFDCEVMEDVTIIASHNEDSSLAADKILTTSGTFEISDSFDFADVGRKGDIFVRNGDDVAAFIPDGSDSGARDKYVVYSQIENAVIGYRNGSFTQIDLTDGTACYKEGVKSTYAAVKNSLEMGDILYVRYASGGTVDYVTYEKGSMEGPVKVVSSDWRNSFDTNSSTAIMRDGNKVSADAIQINDIIYYSGDLNMVLAYTNKITGVYENALPTKDAPSSVVISGKTYSIEGVDAFNALSSSGNLRYGDTVTVLLGRNGEIAGIADTGTGAVSSTSSTAGYVISSGKKDFNNADGTTYSSYYVQLVSADGVVNEYATNSDYKDYVGEVCSASFSNGKVSIRRQTSTSVSGRVNGNAYTIGSTKFAENVKILDVVVSDWYDAVMYKNIYPQRLDGLNIESSKVMYCKKNGSGEITEMILKNVTNDAYSYGAIVSRAGTKGAYTYTIDIDGNQYTYATNVEMPSKIGCRVNIYNGKVERVEPLSAYSPSISHLTDTTARIGNTEYKLSDKVTVYKKTSSVMKIPMQEAQTSNYRLTAYYDKSEAAGGRIRIIIAE